jgi:hypothetical protein
MNRTKGIVFAALLILSLGAYAREAAAAGVTPLFACATLGAGSYVLVADIATVGTCFTLTANDISIVFSGFSITGDGTGQGITDGGAALSGIAIVLGTIRSFGVGIDLFTSTDVQVESMRILGNLGDGIRVGAHSNIRKNIVNNNAGDGIQVTCKSLLDGNIAQGNAVNLNDIGAGCKKPDNLF